MRRFDAGWLITEFVCEDDWANWEMHPEADEFVYLLSGDVALVLELPTGTATIRLSDRGAVVVPRGVWHTARRLAYRPRLRHKPHAVRHPRRRY